MGHGSYLPFSIDAAPFSIIPYIGLFSAPVFWAIVGLLLASRRFRAALAVLMMHTTAVGFVLWFGSPMEPGDEQWKDFWRTEAVIPTALWSAILLYVAGLVVAWAMAPGGASAGAASDAVRPR